MFLLLKRRIVLVGDVTYLRCWERVLVIEVFSRPLVGFQLARRVRPSLVLDALAVAVGTRPSGAYVG